MHLDRFYLISLTNLLFFPIFFYLSLSLCLFLCSASQVARPHVQPARHKRIGVADFANWPPVSGRARSLHQRQAEDTLQRVDIRHLLAEHGSQCRGGSAAGDTLRAGRDYRRHQLPPAAAKFSDRPEEARRAGWSER